MTKPRGTCLEVGDTFQLDGDVYTVDCVTASEPGDGKAMDQLHFLDVDGAQVWCYRYQIDDFGGVYASAEDLLRSYLPYGR